MPHTFRDGVVLARLLLPSASDSKRHNVLEAYDPITHEAITVTNDTYIKQWVFCEFLGIVLMPMWAPAAPSLCFWITPDTKNCQSVADNAKESGIELPYLPPNSPNLNLIERLWRFVKKQVLYKHTLYDSFDAFRTSIDPCFTNLGTRFKANLQTLLTMNFQLLSENRTLTA
ncbi:MAG: transposase [Methylococcaceae bacterium]|nr:transposase [Methylococcaceae bacterium]